MKYSEFYIPTLRDVPSDVDETSAKVFLRAGLGRRVQGGGYALLPYGKLIQDQLQQRMTPPEALEMQVPLHASEDCASRIGGRHPYSTTINKGKQVLGTGVHGQLLDAVRGEITSYKQLPKSFYTAHTRFCEGYGLYTQTAQNTLEGVTLLAEDPQFASMDQLYHAWKEKAQAMGVDLLAVHEETVSGLRMNLYVQTEKTGDGLVKDGDTLRKQSLAPVDISIPTIMDEAEPELLYTPACTTIEQLTELLHVAPNHMAKAVDMLVDGEPVFAFVPGHRDVSLAKVAKHLGVDEESITMMDDETITSLTGSAPGYTGPIGLDEKAKVLVDKRLTTAGALVTGGNKTEHHYKNVVYGRDFTGEVVDDLLLWEDDGQADTLQAVCVGHIEQLDAETVNAFDLFYLDDQGKRQAMTIQRFTLNLSLLMAALLEQQQDDKGLLLNDNFSPFDVIITIANHKDDTASALAATLYQDWMAQGVRVLLDDRKERAGVKFNDRDLIGVPVRVTVGKKAGENIVEFSTRYAMENEDISIDDATSRVCNG